MNGNASTKAREICRQGIFENAYIQLKESGLMKFEVSKTEKCHNCGIDFPFPFSRKDFEMLTILRLFDERTFDHSIDTHHTAKKKALRKLEGGFSFLDVIRSEGVSGEQFERSCLFHDIGKIIIPNFLLDSHYTDENWAQAFSQMPKWRKRWIIAKNKLPIPKDLLDDPEALMEHMIRKRIRGVKFVPIKMLFSKKQLRDLSLRGLYDGMSLLEIIQRHEKESGKILEFMGYPTEAKIAGSHHNYEKENKNHFNGNPKYVLKEGNFSADVLHLADIQEALKSNRPYLSQRPMLRTLAFMIDDAKKGLVDCRITYLWVKDELDRIAAEYLDSVTKSDPDDPDYENLKDRKEEFEIIQKFLSEIKPMMDSSPLPVFKQS